MLLLPTLSTKPEADPGLDQAQLFALGMDFVRAYSRRFWTDHNIHDPGITTLELLCYALTEQTYRAMFPIEDLLDSNDDGTGMAAQFYTARQVLPNGACTTQDFRKLLLDLPGIQNAWIVPEPRTYHADPVAAALRFDDPKTPGIRPVSVRGLYRARVAFDDEVTTPEAQDALRAKALETLRRNRNLCEDFVAVDRVPDQWFTLCGEIDLAPGALAAGVAAQIIFSVNAYLSPRVGRYSLDEMRARTDGDGNPYTPDAVFNGPLPDHGFIDPTELQAAELRTEIRLSDVIAIVMNVDGVVSVRDVVVNALKAPTTDPTLEGDVPELVPIEPPDPWRIPVAAGHRPRLSRTHCRLVMYKGDIPSQPASSAVDARLTALNDAKQQAARDTTDVDLPIPRGRPRATASYRSVQNEFPAVYGLSEAGLPSSASPARRAAALQFQAYLLVFDQVMANFSAQLASLGTLFTREYTSAPTYASQPVTTFRDYRKVYPDTANDQALAAKLALLFESPAGALSRRDRFLDHLLARVASDFHDYVAIMATAFGGNLADSVATKVAFLRAFPDQAARRGQGYDLLGATSDPLNVSGFERRLTSLLRLTAEEPVALVENLLLLPRQNDPNQPDPLLDEPFLPICIDPNCTDCADDDPYSYQLVVVLPADAGRFQNMDFRRFVEGVIRREMPAHVMPRVCWADDAHWTLFSSALTAWKALPGDSDRETHRAAVVALIDALQAVKNVYPEQKLHGCDAGSETPPFVLGRSALGSDRSLNT